MTTGGWRRRLLAGAMLAGVVLPLALPGATADEPPAPPAGGTAPASASDAAPAAAAPAAARGKSGAAPYQYRPARFAGRAGQFYRHMWGIDQLVVKEAESGQLLRFTWRVVDPERAAPLNDRQIEPTLVAPERGVALVVPVLDKIGQLRQTIPPEAGRSYWMAFSNKGHLIRRGDRVDVVVGTFRAEGLVVD